MSRRSQARELVHKAAGKIAALFPIGVSGLKRSGGYVYDEFHPKLRGKKAIETFREMADNDAVCGSILWSHESFIRQADRNLMPAVDDDPRALYYRDRIGEMFEDLDETRQEHLSDVMSMEWAGHSVHEVVWKVRRGQHELAMLRSRHNDGLVAPRKIAIRAQDSIDQWQWSEAGELLGFYQQAWPKFEYKFLPMSRCMLYRVRHNKANPEGKSILRNGYRSWHFLKRIQELEAIGVERDMAGMLVFQLPTAYFQKTATAAQRRAIARWRKIVARARRSEYDGLVVPAEKEHGKETGYKASLMQSGGRRPMDTDGIIRRLESRIAISVLGEAVLLGMQGNVGSWSLASSKTHMFAVALGAVMQSIDDTENRFLIPEIMQLNGWPLELAPWWQFGDIENDDATQLMTALVQAVQAELIHPDQDLERYLRARMGLPKMGDVSPAQLEDAAGVLAEREAANDDAVNDLAAQQAVADVVPIAQADDAPSEYMTANEIAEMLNISPMRVRNAIQRGQLKGGQVGRDYFAARKDVLAYFRGKRAA